MAEPGEHESPLRMRFVADSFSTYAALAERSDRALSRLREGETLANYASRREEVLARHLNVIDRQTSSFDAFDLLELLRQREMPGDFDNFKETSFDGIQAVTELAAALILSRGRRRAEKPRAGGRPDLLIDMIHRRLSEVLTINHWFLLEQSVREAHGPLTELAARHVAHVVTVRGDGFPSIRGAIEDRLFGPARIQDAMERHLGFRYDDFVRIREAVDQQYVLGWNSRLDKIPDYVLNARTPPEPEALDGPIAAAFIDLFIRPGSRAAFRAEEIAERLGLNLARTAAVLDAFAREFGTKQSLVAAEEFLRGQNDFRAASLVRDDEGNYLALAGSMGHDTSRQLFERALKSTRDWNSYMRHRSSTAETLAIEKVERALRADATFLGLKYWAPTVEADVARLNRDATSVRKFAKEGESDGVFIIEDVMICVEVKGGAFSDGARQGRVNKLETDLEKLVGDATRQAHRLEQLVEANGGIWTLDNRWVDLSHVREIRSIVVTLDDLGFLGTAIDELVRAGVIKGHRLPWIVALSDLWLIADVVDRPSEFLLYLFKRSDPLTAMHFVTMDELDLFMLFLRGELRVALDPRRTVERYPAVGPPSAPELEAYEVAPKATRVTTLTDGLDAWKYFVDGVRSVEAPKPSFRVRPLILHVVDFLHRGHRPGWFSFSPVLLNLSEEHQRAFSEVVAEVVSRIREDKRVHCLSEWTVDEFGLSVLAVVGKPKQVSRAEVITLAEDYLGTKTRELGAERGLALIIDRSGRIVDATYVHEGGTP